jgi:uncharacterized repeat protein (TIGR01451 family)
MNKQWFLSHLQAILLICLFAAPVWAQQNQKIVFPNTSGFEKSSGLSAQPTADGGYLLYGQLEKTDIGNLGAYVLPRFIKLDANLNTVWDKTYLQPDPGHGAYIFPIGKAVELADGSFLCGLHNDSTQFELLHFGADGSQLGVKDYPGFSRATILLGNLPGNQALGVRNYYDNGEKTALMHLDSNGDIVSSTDMPANSAGYTQLSNGDVLYGKWVAAVSKYAVVKAGNNGTTIWENPPVPGIGANFIPLPGGGYGFLNYVSTYTYKLKYFDASGHDAGQSPDISIDGNVNRTSVYPDGSILFSGATVTGRAFMLRAGTDGSTIWSAQSPEDGQAHLQEVYGFTTSDGWAIGSGSATGAQFGFLRIRNNSGIVFNTLSGTVAIDNNKNCALETGEYGLYVAQVKVYNNAESFTTFTAWNGSYSIKLPAGDFTVQVSPNEPFLFTCPQAPNTVSFAPNANGNATLDIPMQSLDLIHEISGTLRLDANGNCSVDAGDPVLPNWHLLLLAGLKYIDLVTNGDGQYKVLVPDGAFKITAYPWNLNFGFCGNPEQDVVFNSASPQTVTVDFLANKAFNCARMRTVVNGAVIRACTNRYIDVAYRNDGTETAIGATLEVDLDTKLAYLGASKVPESIDGNKLFFNLGDIPPTPGGSWGTIKIHVKADCDLQIGNQVCVTASVKPDEICATTPAWNGAIVALDGHCEGDSAFFIIKNVGNATNAHQLDFVIVEDQIVLLQGKFQLAPGASQIEGVLPVNPDSSIVMIAQQEPGYPGDTTVTFALNNCIGHHGSPTGVAGNPGPFSSQLCMTVSGPYDPNSKSAYPEGYGSQHIVRMGTPLDYVIRFQNTGTDTAFTVVLRDTLSRWLDHSRVEMTGASHPCELYLVGDSILHISFRNIMLPDSNTNMKGSEGYAAFRVYPKPGMEPGTLVDNRAAIYFDFNKPVITNNVRRKYDNWVLVLADKNPAGGLLNVKVYPNPFVDNVTIELPENASGGSHSFELFDTDGRLIKQTTFEGRRLTLNRDQLPAGVVMWRIGDAGVVVASGRMVVQDER